MTYLGDLLKDMVSLSGEQAVSIRTLFQAVKTLAEENNELRAKLWNLERRINKVEMK